MSTSAYFCRPVASAAATGSSRRSINSRFANLIASMVDLFYASEKYAGIVTTHFLELSTPSSSLTFAASLIFSRTCLETYSGRSSF